MLVSNEQEHLYEALVEKWRPIIDSPNAVPIKDKNKRVITAVMLENQEDYLLTQEQTLITESLPTTHTGSVNNWNPVLISLVRRTLPNLIAHDIVGVQPMTGPTGLIFALRSRYGGGEFNAQANREALFNEAETTFSGHGGVHDSDNVSGLKDVDSDHGSSSPGGKDVNADSDSWSEGRQDSIYGTGKTTQEGEQSHWDSDGAHHFRKMGFTIERQSVTAKTRNLAADYSIELAQDLKAIHALDAKTELSNILSTEIIAEINREIIRVMNSQARTGARTSNVGTKGIFNIKDDTDGRWMIERYKGLIMQLSRECNQIAKDTRRGRGNFIVTSSDVASALEATHLLDYSKPMSTELEVDDTGNTFAGTINGRLKVYIDPYTDHDYATVGYRGESPYDAGIFYCPYIPLTMLQAVSESTFQPRIGFKTRYGITSNPFVFPSSEEIHPGGLSAARSNYYYRIFRVDDLIAGE